LKKSGRGELLQELRSRALEISKAEGALVPIEVFEWNKDDAIVVDVLTGSNQLDPSFLEIVECTFSFIPLKFDPFEAPKSNRNKE
jgi:hypothetical protein